MPPKKSTTKKSSSVKSTTPKKSKKKAAPVEDEEMQIVEDPVTQPESPPAAEAPKLVQKEYQLRKMDQVKNSKTVAKKLKKLIEGKDSAKIAGLL